MIEPLEPRIAPASVAIAGNTAKWTDWDGDLVTMTWSAGAAPTFSKTDKGAGLLVDKIAFAAGNSGANVSIAVKTIAGSDGRIDLGRVDATLVPLGAWTSPRVGIAEFDAGDGARAVKSFVSGSLGVQDYGHFTGTGGDGLSTFSGKVDTLLVRGDIGSTKVLIAAGGATLKSVTVLGDLLGTLPTAGVLNGVLEINADKVGSVFLGGSILGGDDANEGSLRVLASADKITVKGDVHGGEDFAAGGLVMGGVVKSLTVGGSLYGGTMQGAGYISGINVGSFTLGGSILGGREVLTGTVEFTGNVGSATIKGSIAGTQDLGSGSNQKLAAVTIGGNVGSFTLGGSIIAGSAQAGSTINYNGALFFGKNVGALTVKGSLLGSDTTPVRILALGEAPAKPGNYQAIGKLTVGVNVFRADIAAGHSANTSSAAEAIGSAENVDAGIGAVTVGGSWLHSNLTAGVNDVGSDGFTANDTAGLGDPTRLATIGAIVIRGDLLDHHSLTGFSGFGAQRIASLGIGGIALFTTGGGTKVLDFDGYVKVKEV